MMTQNLLCQHKIEDGKYYINSEFGCRLVENLLFFEQRTLVKTIFIYNYRVFVIRTLCREIIT